MSTPLKPPPPYCTERPFQSRGRLSWKLMLGAVGSIGLRWPRTLQKGGVAGVMRAPGVGPFSATAKGRAATIAALSIATGPLARPIAEAGTSAFMRAAQAASVLLPNGMGQAADPAGYPPIPTRLTTQAAIVRRDAAVPGDRAPPRVVWRMASIPEWRSQSPAAQKRGFEDHNGLSVSSSAGRRFAQPQGVGALGRPPKGFVGGEFAFPFRFGLSKYGHNPAAGRRRPSKGRGKGEAKTARGLVAFVCSNRTGSTSRIASGRPICLASHRPGVPSRRRSLANGPLSVWQTPFRGRAINA